MRRWRWAALTLAAGMLVLALVWRLLPPGSPPLYDGLCVVNPYQYVSPPPSTENQPPLPASKDLDVSGGQPGTELITGETPPQATLELGDGALAVPAGVSRVTLRITPVAPPSDSPTDGTIDGNVYRFEVNAGASRTVALAAGRNAEILLRPASSGTGRRTLERHDAGGWTRLDTSAQSCAETQAAVTTALGDFAVVDVGPVSSSGSSAGIWLAGGAVLVVATAIVLIRINRAGPRRSARSPRRR